MKLICDAQWEIEVKRSRFICYLHRVDEESEAREFIKSIRKMHPQARHVCSAFVIGDLKRSSDDGEPSGTAGRPILSVLENAGADHIVAAVVRYFGGTLLGTGGLVRAYGDVTGGALKEAAFSVDKKLGRYSLSVPYELSGKVEAYFAREQVTITAQSYTDVCQYEFVSERDLSEAIASLTGGRCIPLYGGDVLVETAL